MMLHTALIKEQNALRAFALEECINDEIKKDRAILRSAPNKCVLIGFASRSERIRRAKKKVVNIARKGKAPASCFMLSSLVKNYDYSKFV